jgi:hypothetical protein
LDLVVIVVLVQAISQEAAYGSWILDAVIICFLSAPGGVYFAWEEEGIVTVLSEIVAKVIFPRFELLEGEAVRWKLIWGSKLQCVCGTRSQELWSLLRGGAPPCSSDRGLRRTKRKKKKRSQYYPRGASSLSSGVLDGTDI